MASPIDQIKNQRRDFNAGELSESDVNVDPLKFFKSWLEDAILAAVEEPYAMVVSTVDQRLMPQSRVVYLRDIVEEGFIFYTNYESNKALQLANSANIALNFLWTKLDRQVRVTGQVERVPEEMSDDYFAGRPRESQIGAWASNQSRTLNSRQELLDLVARFEKKFEGQTIPRPAHWGGYLVKPQTIEFWQGRTARLHDRLHCAKTNKQWNISRLAP